MTRDHQHNPDPNENLHRIVAESVVVHFESQVFRDWCAGFCRIVL